MTEKISTAEDQLSALDDLVTAASEKLELTSQSVTSQAFNLGCTVGVIPAGVIILSIIFISKGNLTTILISVLITVILLAIFASFAAYKARSRTIARVSQEEVFPWMDSEIQKMSISREELIDVIEQKIPNEGLLRRYLEFHPADHSLNFDKE